MTIQEIEEFVQGELSYLNLSTSQQRKYVNFVKKYDNYYQLHNLLKNPQNTLLEKLEECIEFFMMQGFDDKISLEYAKNVLPEFDRKDLKEKISFLRILNLEERIVGNGSYSFRFVLREAHAKKMYLVVNNIRNFQTNNMLFHQSNDFFEEKFNVKMETLNQQYPLTQETKDIWMFITQMNDEKFHDFFGMTRDELSYIYPTTKEEIAVIHKIATLSDEEIIETYGILRKELLQKHPLNNDTLKAIKSIHKSSSKVIEKIFDQPKEEVLHLRTITTEMIKIAANGKNIQIKKATYSRDELRERLMNMKKGTYPNR